jgi:hypothetical protein
MAIIGAGYFMPRGEHTTLLRRVLPALAARPALEGPRVMVKGSPLDHPLLHQVIERHGAVVVAEDDWWGARSAGAGIAGASVTALFRMYYADTPSPRVFPAAAADAWFVREVLRGIDAVVYYLPPDDDVLGWDYPRHRRFLETHGIPSTLVRDDARHLTPEVQQQVAGFIAGVVERRR